MVFNAIGQLLRRSVGARRRGARTQRRPHRRRRPSAAPASRRLGGRRLRLWRPGSDRRGGRGRQAGGALDRRCAAAMTRRRLKETPWPICASISSASNPPIRSGSPPRRRPTARLNVERAFHAGWGGVVWKTLGEAGPPVVNVSGARYGALHGPDRRLIALQQHRAHHRPRPRDQPARRSRRSSARWPDRALIVSLMVPCDEESWKNILRARRRDRMRRRRTQLRLPARHVGARHGLGGRPGARIYRDGRALVQGAHPHAGDRQADAQYHRHPPPGARGQGGRRRRGSLINTINSIMGVDLDAHDADAAVDGKGTHGGMCGPAVKPIALSHGLGDRPRSGDARACRSRPSAASPPGATRPSSSRSAPATCRSAPRR